ncbi:MAG TPA: DNA replication and repair protein RecF [Polyangiaceae bacterium]|nr:DNA replication and repair protein RecF [Polyangiaceae bacterium]
MSGPGSAALRITRLRLESFRNIPKLSFEPAPRFNVISGDNGQGKTSLLEAIYCLATTRSFRTEQIKELRRDVASFARVDAELLDGDQRRSQRLTLSAEGRGVYLDEQKVARLSEYAIRTPVVVFHPGDLELTMGGATARRDLLDRVGLFGDPSLLDDRRRYRQALRERQKALELRGEHAPELDAYETLVAQHGARLCSSRARAAEELASAAQPGFRRLAAADLTLEMAYKPGGSGSEQEFRSELAARRGNDRRRHAASYGPHKDDLTLTVGGRLARKTASQGQHRILALSLKLGELHAIERARAAHPLLLLDDVSSELDPTRIGAVQSFLRESQSQVFVTTTRADLFQTPGAGPLERRDYRLRAGLLEPSE